MNNNSEFSIVAVHIMDQCSPYIRKILSEEFYIMDSRCYVDKNKRVRLKTSNKMDNFFGKGIHIQTIVGVNGSGKTSLLEIIYRIINNLSCLLVRGKRRNASEMMSFIDGLWAELYYTVDGALACISCRGNDVSFGIGNKKHPLKAFDDENKTGLNVKMESFIEWARESLFYTIVTNYSMQAFCASDYSKEPCFCLDNGGKRKYAIGAIWMNGLFHKNDGYMTPIVLNPYRDEGKIDVVKEHRLTIYRLSTAMLYAEQRGRMFMKDYKLNNINYQFDESIVIRKYVELEIPENTYRNYRSNNAKRRTYGTAILKAYGFNHLNHNNIVHHAVAMYLIIKTFSIAKKYPAYQEFSDIGDPLLFNKAIPEKNEKLINALVDRINKDKSHITIKIKQVLHFIDAIKRNRFDAERVVKEPISYRDYFSIVAPDNDLKNAGDIQAYLPPSFFKIDILVDHLKDGVKLNKEPITVDRMSSGERQYLYTFSTYIYHILNLLSIQESYRVRYRRFNLVFDEVEICFHPEFQRRFINELIGYIQRMYMNVYATYNIIIATHSPFILTDIPQSNILYLEDGRIPDSSKFKNPFAANICDVLYQSFFLKEGFVGEFARNKVNEMLRWLESGKMTQKRKEQFDFMCSLIGDPFVKMQIMQLYKKRRGK